MLSAMSAVEPCQRHLMAFWLCRLDKVRENAAALEVLPDLLREVDALPPGDRLASLVQGVRRSGAGLHHNRTQVPDLLGRRTASPTWCNRSGIAARGV